MSQKLLEQEVVWLKELLKMQMELKLKLIQ